MVVAKYTDRDNPSRPQWQYHSIVSNGDRWWIAGVLDVDRSSMFVYIINTLKTMDLDGFLSRSRCDRSVGLVRGCTCSMDHPFDKTAHNNGISIINSTRSTGISTAAEQEQHEDKRADREVTEEEHADIRPHGTISTTQDEPELEDNEYGHEAEHDDLRLSYWAITTSVKITDMRTGTGHEQQADKEEPEVTMITEDNKEHDEAQQDIKDEQDTLAVTVAPVLQKQIAGLTMAEPVRLDRNLKIAGLAMTEPVRLDRNLNERPKSITRWTKDDRRMFPSLDRCRIE